MTMTERQITDDYAKDGEPEEFCPLCSLYHDTLRY